MGGALHSQYCRGSESGNITIATTASSRKYRWPVPCLGLKAVASNLRSCGISGHSTARHRQGGVCARSNTTVFGFGERCLVDVVQHGGKSLSRIRAYLNQPSYPRFAERALRDRTPANIPVIRWVGATHLHERSSPSDGVEKTLNYTLGAVRGVYNRAHTAIHGVNGFSIGPVSLRPSTLNIHWPTAKP